MTNLNPKVHLGAQCPFFLLCCCCFFFFFNLTTNCAGYLSWRLINEIKIVRSHVARERRSGKAAARQFPLEKRTFQHVDLTFILLNCLTMHRIGIKTTPKKRKKEKRKQATRKQKRKRKKTIMHRTAKK